MYDLEDYQPEHKDAVIGLLGDHEYKKRIWDWQFHQNPFLEGNSPGVILKDKDKIIGYYGSMPVPIQLGDRKFIGAWLCDLILDPEYRGKGLGKKLNNYLQNKYPMVLGLGISDHSDPILKKAGWVINYDIEEYNYIKNTANVKDVIKKMLQLVKSLKGTFCKRAQKNYIVEEIEGKDVKKYMDLLEQEEGSGYSNGIIKDFKYIEWKYLNHPVARYRYLIAKKQDKLMALGIIRNGKLKSRFVEYLGADELDAKYILTEKFMQICNSSLMLNVLTTDDDIKKSCDLLGFMRYKSKPRFYLYSGKIDKAVLAGKWFIMAGDSDEDILEAARDSIVKN